MSTFLKIGDARANCSRVLWLLFAPLWIFLVAGDVHAREVYVHGPISGATVSAFDAIATRETVTSIRIRSEGGEEGAAIDIAERVARHKIPVAVDGYCMSSCFFIFVASERRMIKSNSFVALHIYTASYFEGARRHLSAQEIRLGALLTKRTNALFKSSKVSPEILQVSERLLEIVCADNKNRAGSTWIRTRRNWWAPDDGTLNDFGIMYSGTQGKAPADIKSRVYRYLKSTSVGWVGPPPFQGIAQRKKDIPAC